MSYSGENNWKVWIKWLWPFAVAGLFYIATGRFITAILILALIGLINLVRQRVRS